MLSSSNCYPLVPSTTDTCSNSPGRVSDERMGSGGRGGGTLEDISCSGTRESRVGAEIYCSCGVWIR